MIKNNKKVNSDNIKKFFEERANKHDENNPLKSVIYQDKNPSLAKERDLYERNKIRNLLKISKDDVVLDVGCGIGRWAGEMSGMVKKYIGIDYINEFINIAKTKYKSNSNTYFICLDGTKLSNFEVKNHSPYNVIMIIGFFMYIDTEESYEVLRQILEVSANESQIIIREPIGVDKEVVLDNVWSEEMETFYSARYRTCDQFKKIFNDVLIKKGYNLIIDEALFPEQLNNRIDTRQHLFYLKKNSI